MFCCVPGCCSRYGKDKISFHQFPKKNGPRFQRWLEAIGGKMAEASSGAFVCGRHFVSGKAARSADTDSVDWVPTLYMDGTGPPALTAESATAGAVYEKRPYVKAATKAAAKAPVEEGWWWWFRGGWGWMAFFGDRDKLVFEGFGTFLLLKRTGNKTNGSGTGK